MLITFFNIFLIIVTTFVTYKYFALLESITPSGSRVSGYVKGIAEIVDKAEGYDSSHSYEMAEMAVQIGKKLSFSAEALESLQLAAFFHDIGELLLPREILRKAGQLDDDKHFLMRTHPLLGELRLKNPDNPFDEVSSIIRWHHERYDGTGYPDGLKGEEIPVCSRIIALVDAVSAMKNERPYRNKIFSDKEIVQELERMSGLQFDPYIVKVWIGLNVTSISEE